MRFMCGIHFHLRYKTNHSVVANEVNLRSKEIELYSAKYVFFALESSKKWVNYYLYVTIYHKCGYPNKKFTYTTRIQWKTLDFSLQF